MANIKDIAKLSGVSVATVSRVLNNHPYVSDEKRQNVQQVIEALEFQQNLNAIHLVKGKTLTIGVIIPYIDIPFFQLVMDGIMKEAFTHHYAVLSCATNYDKKEELRYLNMLKGKHIDGLIICSRANSWETIMPYIDYGPIITCEKHDQLPCVYIDHYKEFLTGMAYLLEKGHQKIGYCTSRKGSLSSQMRYAGYEKYLQNIQQPIQHDWIFTDCFTMADGKRVMNQLCHLKDMASAILTNGDEVAAGMMIQADKLGIQVPEQLSIMGMDNLPMSEALGLTTLDLNAQKLGKQAFHVFQKNTNEKVQIPSQLMERRTVFSLNIN